MKKIVLLATAGALALSGCDAGRDIVSAEDANKLKNNEQCSQSARVMVAMANEALQSKRIAEIVGEPAKRANAMIAAEHDFSNLQLYKKYNERGGEEVDKIVEAAGNDLRAKTLSAGNKSNQYDFIKKFIDENCHSQELIAENIETTRKDKSLRSERDRLFDQALATTVLSLSQEHASNP
jgi:hypothetical protein